MGDLEFNSSPTEQSVKRITLRKIFSRPGSMTPTRSVSSPSAAMATIRSFRRASRILTAPPSVELLQIEEGGR
jgi:hypothetical protein